MRRPPLRLVQKALRTRFVDRRPFVLSHLLTARCNADCLTCLWKQPADAKTDELATAEVQRLYEEAAAAGFLSVVVWGGEPTLRPDLGQVLARARSVGLETTLITNGFSLAERGQQYLPFVDRIVVSVDGIGEVHDRLRRCPGLYRRIVLGLHALRRGFPGLRVILLCVLSRPNLGEIEGVSALGRAFSAQVVFQSMNLEDYGFADRALDRGLLELSAPDERAAFDRIATLQRRGVDIKNSSDYLARLGAGPIRYRCHYKKVVCRVEPNGDILDCTRVAAPLCNVRTTPLRDHLAGALFKDFVRRAEACNRCRDTGVIEASHIWEGRPAAIGNAVRALF